ncbi:hypothetical protein [Herbaspirillum sp. YR522]|uniref:hypothetical protein n=1 Tax=Herbaspirillum sp. YR522 TaxID=1144342 RepID=UPI001EE64702|nr:hypothetical protein [Herbaspirillum sp. YR522]
MPTIAPSFPVVTAGLDPAALKPADLKSASVPVTTPKVALSTDQQRATGPAGLALPKTSQTRLRNTARHLQQVTQALGEELMALHEQLRGQTDDDGQAGGLIRRNRLKTRLGNLMDKTSEMSNFRLFPTSTPHGEPGRLAALLLERQRQAGGPQPHVLAQLGLEQKLQVLFDYHPQLAGVVERAGRGKVAAAVQHMASSSPRVDLTLDAIDDMYAQVRAAREQGHTDAHITQMLSQATSRLQASGGIFGRASTRIRNNPGNNDEVDANMLGKWIAQGKPVATTETVRYGFINKAPGVVDTDDQVLLEKWLGVAGFDTSEVAGNTPLLVRECADREHLSQAVEEPLRKRLIVDEPFEVFNPAGARSDESTPLLHGAATTTVEIEQVPMLLALKYVICGQDQRVHQDVLKILDDARIIEAFSSHDPALAEKISGALRGADQPAAMRLHRKLVAAELMNTFLEGGSALETAKDVAPYALGGMFMEAVKHLTPDGLPKSIVTELFLGGADLGDNGMGCMAELRSQAMTVKGIEVGGIADLYEKTFGQPGANMGVMLAHLALLGAGAANPESKLAGVAKAMGFVKPTGPLAAITETQMQSFLTGSGVSVAMTTLYSGAGALSSNPAFLALLGAGAIMGTSISPAIGFGILHAELALAVKKRLVDRTLAPPQELALSDDAAVTRFCHKEAMNQLMMQTGNGAGNIAFLFAPLAASAKLLGFAVPKELVDLVLEPLMPGMENIVRVGAMDDHEASKRDAIKKIKEKCIEEAADGNATPMTLDDFDAMTLSGVDRVAAQWSLTIASPFVWMLGRSHYPDLVPVPSQADAPDTRH